MFAEIKVVKNESEKEGKTADGFAEIHLTAILL
jgi:hypothetical protein